MNRYGRLLGGVRVSQRRGAVVADCTNTPYGDIVTAVVGGPGSISCYPVGSDSRAPYGLGANTSVIVTRDAVQLMCSVEYTPEGGGPTSTETRVARELDPTEDVGALDADAECGPARWADVVRVVSMTSEAGTVSRNVTVASAFTPGAALISNPPPQLASLADVTDPFAVTLDYYGGGEEAAIKVSLLEGAGWVDDATSVVHVLFAVVNVDIGYWARALFTVTFTRGGRVLNTAEVRSLPVDPYAGRPALVLLDVVILLYIAFFLSQTLGSSARKCRRAWKAHRRGDGAWAASSPLRQSWYLLDVATAVGFVATASAWVAATATLAQLRLAVTGHAWSPDTVADDTLLAQAWVEAAVRDLGTYKALAIASLALFMMRLFWQFSLQPRLAVMSETLSRSCSDIAHFAVLFTVILVFFGVWATVYFGGQVDRWSTPWSSMWGIASYLSYEYDLVPMQSVDDQAGRLFHGSFMFIITNLLLWMFFAIVFDYYR